VTDDQGKKPYAEIVFPIPVDHPFTYAIPERFLEDVVPGMRVLAPFGPRKITGFVVGRKDETDFKELKEIEEILDPVPLFTTEVLALAKWIADYYLCGWGEVLKAALPAGIHLMSEKVIRLTHDDPAALLDSLLLRAPKQAEVVRLLAANNPMPYPRLLKQVQTSSIYSILKALRLAGHLRIELSLPKAKVRKKFETFVELTDAYGWDDLLEIAEELRQKSPKQAKCLEFLLAFPDQEFTRTDLAKRSGVSSTIIKSLADRGIITLKQEEIYRDYYASRAITSPPDITLNPDQRNSLEQINVRIDAAEFNAFLLHGVTGSGKTQVYIEAIHHVLAKGRTAIVMVPEIALTPQMVSRFRSHFGDKVAVFHSRMSPGERYDSWRRTWEGRHQIIIGPRSAIFAPLTRVGLVVVDEEHEPSYKQVDLTPRYHARDVAVVRAKLSNAVVVLGSATPSLESYFNFQIGKFHLLSLPSRIDNVPMPVIEIVDMRREPKIIGRKDPIVFSRLLRKKIDEKLALGEQIILFLNRRGFATLIKCQDCGYTARCNDCDITLTYHLAGHFLKCHYCGYARKAPDACPECNGANIFFRGIGTQRVEEEMHVLFPGIDAVRMDLDTTRGKWAHDKILSKFASGEHQILLGTQMVAKGLDFPRVTLVGVISADTELLFPDFRAGERTFQLLTQVAGRAGRKDRKGEVVIQSYSPDHYSLYYAKSHDYLSFYKAELTDRRSLGYPPYSRIINMLFRGPDEISVKRVADLLGKTLERKGEFKMLGPSPAPLSKLQGNFRYQILFMSLKQSDAGGQEMKKTIRSALTAFKQKHRARKVHISIDVDPVSIM
jgi:primosomal protein N' (replication factor Y)